MTTDMPTTPAVLFVDFETSDMLHREQPDLSPRQPHIVQAAFVLRARDGRTIARHVALVRPEGWEINPAAEAVHGITLADCRAYGLPVAVIVAALNQHARAAEVIVAHNAEFDLSMWRIEAARLRGPFRGDVPQVFCTMRHATPVCKLPGKRNGFKWPKLSEAHAILTGRQLENAHDALADLDATARVFDVLRTRYADTPPTAEQTHLFNHRPAVAHG